jgi:hypothetical protein
MVIVMVIDRRRSSEKRYKVHKNFNDTYIALIQVLV